MDVRYINPFMAGIKNVFTTMLGTEVLFSKPSVKTAGQPNLDVAAIIGFSGQAAGSVALCFSNRTAVAVASKFAGAEIDKNHPDFGDALGELANMVAGQAKSKIEGLNISVSLPRVIAGRDLQVLESSTTPILVLPCDSELGRFTTEVTMVVEGGQARPSVAAPPIAERTTAEA